MFYNNRATSGWHVITLFKIIGKYQSSQYQIYNCKPQQGDSSKIFVNLTHIFLLVKEAFREIVCGKTMFFLLDKIM